MTMRELQKILTITTGGVKATITAGDKGQTIIDFKSPRFHLRATFGKTMRAVRFDRVKPDGILYWLSTHFHVPHRKITVELFEKAIKTEMYTKLIT